MPVILSTFVASNRAMLRAAALKRVGPRRRRLPKMPRIFYPNAVERRYRKLMRAYVAQMRALVNEILMPELPQILDAATLARPSLDSVALDEYDYAAEVTKLLELISTNFAGSYTDEELGILISRIAEAVAVQNGKELGKVFASVLGVDVFASEPWLAIELRAFVTSNVGLIKTIPAKYFAEIEQKVFDAARKGISYKELQKDIQKSYGSSRARAELIARDQIGKFNGQLALVRQTQAGLRRYQWVTMRDARVRHTHRARDGQVFSWDQPPSGGHPGEDYQCRCQALPFLDDLWKLPGEELTPVPDDQLGVV